MRWKCLGRWGRVGWVVVSKRCLGFGVFCVSLVGEEGSWSVGVVGLVDGLDGASELDASSLVVTLTSLCGVSIPG